MMDQHNPDFLPNQQVLLLEIQKQSSSINEDFHNLCRAFLQQQEHRLCYLKEQRNVHLNERGRVLYRLESVEKVSLFFLKQIYAEFAKTLEQFLQLFEKLSKKTHTDSLAIIADVRQKGLMIACQMIQNCAVLDNQPECTNYEKKFNKVPNLIFLGVQCLSDFTIVTCHVTAVGESELNSTQENGDLESLEIFPGFELNTNKKEEASDKMTTEKDCITKVMGSWSLKKGKLHTMEKGRAHKDFLRLRYFVKVILRGISINLMLLSIPFNIRKSSCQLYTFRGALMWYFYTTKHPYKDFTVSDREDTTTVVNMLTTRIGAIGRKVSDVAGKFFMDRLKILENSHGKVELETLAKGPATSAKNSNKQSNKTSTADETISCYGFFTWFYALAKSLEGYLHDMWIQGYIYDICDAPHEEGIMNEPEFGKGVVIFRPSTSQIITPQGENIGVPLALAFKHNRTMGGEKVYHLSLPQPAIERTGVYSIIFDLPLQFIYKSNSSYVSLEELKTAAAQPDVNYYHGTRSQFGNTAHVSSDNGIITKNCLKCCCPGVNGDCDPQEQHGKRARNSFSNSDLSSLLQESLPHKEATLASHRSNFSMDLGRPVDEMPSLSPLTLSSPGNNMGSPNASKVSSTTGLNAPDAMFANSVMNEGQRSFQDCLNTSNVVCDTFNPNVDLNKPLGQASQVSSTTGLFATDSVMNKRQRSILECLNTFNALYSCNFNDISDESITQLTNYMHNLSTNESTSNNVDSLVVDGDGNDNVIDICDIFDLLESVPDIHN